MKAAPPASLALAALLASGAAAPAANLLINGDFAYPNLPPGYSFYFVNEPALANDPAFGWQSTQGLASVFDGGGEITVSWAGWPLVGSSGLQYGGITPYDLTYQDFTVPSGSSIRSVTWYDNNPFQFNGGTYTVTLQRLPGGEVVATQEFFIPLKADTTFDLPWRPRNLPLSQPSPGPGRYRLSFLRHDESAISLLDEVVVEAGFDGSTLAADPGDPANGHAYAANAGWLNARPSATDGLQVLGTHLGGRVFFANLGWLDLGDGSPANGSAYSQTPGDHGVNIHADGTLSGYAYAANAGWVNFSWAAPGAPGRPQLDRTTGLFSGYAYAANLGWLHLGGDRLRHDVVAFPDTDFDRLPDAWELAQFGNLIAASAITDFDGDGVNDLNEYQTGTNPRDVDSPASGQTSTIAPGAGHLYSANAGWIDARPSARFGLKVGEYFLAGWLSAPNFGWLHVGNGTPRNGHAYSNSPTTPDDYGVNLDATGALSGYAYGPNIGWINFGWAAPNDPNRPRVDLASGLLTGYVYSANLGWITLHSGNLRTTALQRLDTDADGMDDVWERENFGTLGSAGVGTDADGDGQTDAAEYIAGTDPQSKADYFRILGHTVDGGLNNVTLEFSSSETRRYRIEHTTQLTGGVWSDSPLGEFSPDSGVRTTRSFSLPASVPMRFFRVKAILPLNAP